MARPARLIAWLLPGLVLVAHLAVVEWMARQRQPQPASPEMPELPAVLYTRIVQPTAPAPVAVVQPRPVVREKRRPAAAATPAAVVPMAPEPPEQPAAPVPESIAPAAPAEAVAEAEAPDVPASETTADPLATWPADTRLTYRLEGQYRGGPVYGEAQVHWQRDGGRYQARLDLAVRFFGSVRMTSEGEATPQGLLPHAFEEVRPGQRRVARFGPQVVALERGRRALRPPGLQDTVSQFVELTHRFATGREVLAVGHSVRFPMARPDGVDAWTYDVVASELLQTPELGAVQAFHLQPRPIANPRGDITADMWFAPSLQYLPVRIRVALGDGAFIDLLVEKIEQR